MHRLLIACLVACPAILLAQAPQTSANRDAQPAETGTGLSVKRVILYKTGVGYFEHLGSVRDRQNVTVRFTSAQLNDVLKSLTVLDLGKGQITGISYNSVAPLDQRLGALRLPLDQTTNAREMLASLRGARIEITAAGAAVEGRLLGVEQRSNQHGSETTSIDVLSLITEAGELRTFDLSPAVRVRIVERDLRQEVGRYLDLVGSTREQDVRNMVISTTGAGERQLFVSYISEVPIWKSTYRLVLPSQGKPFLQGWAIVDNTIGEDWRDVELSLVAGAPQSFIQNISQPYYAQRPVVGLPSTVLMTPQTHQAAFGEGTGAIAGVVRDTGGAVLPGVTVRLSAASGAAGLTVTGADGRYRLTAPAGMCSLRFELSGFAPRVFESVIVRGGSESPLDIAMQVGSASEAIMVAGAAGDRIPRAGPAFGGRVGGNGGGIPAAPAPPPPAMPASVYDQARDSGTRADTGSLADLFEYRIREPITLRKNQSALVPIVNTDVAVEKVSLWNRGAGSGRPVRAVWLTNATGLTLDGGSITVVDGNAFAGEGLVDPLKAGERRLISYAADLGVIVDARRQPADPRIFRVRAHDGVLVEETEERVTSTYRARNENATPTTLVIEHRLAPGWTLAEGQTPAESTADAQRFRLLLPAGKETALDVREVRQGGTRITVADADDTLITRLVQSGVPSSALETALRPIIAKKTEIAQLERRMQSLDGEGSTIVSDQQRLRENMKALRGSAEEKQLLQRYTRQLDEQENRIDTLKQEMTTTSQQLVNLRTELAALIANASFEVTATRPTTK